MKIQNFKYGGIKLKDCSGISIINNIVTNNTYYGIDIADSRYTHTISRKVIIYHNFFIDNTVQADCGYPNPTIVWDYGYPSGGNYWSDYKGVDYHSGSHQDEPGSDGIGDSPYTIDSDIVDRYPLMTMMTVFIKPKSVKARPGDTIRYTIMLSWKPKAWRKTINVTITIWLCRCVHHRSSDITISQLHVYRRELRITPSSNPSLITSISIKLPENIEPPTCIPIKPLMYIKLTTYHIRVEASVNGFRSYDSSTLEIMPMKATPHLNLIIIIMMFLLVLLFEYYALTRRA